MSILIGNGNLITTYETGVTCPICEFKFDTSAKSEKSKSPVFNMKCPRCKGKVQVYIPIFGGNTTCSEIGGLAKHRNITVTPNTINGVPYPPKKLYDDNSDEPSDILV